MTAAYDKVLRRQRLIARVRKGLLGVNSREAEVEAQRLEHALEATLADFT